MRRARESRRCRRQPRRSIPHHSTSRCDEPLNLSGIDDYATRQRAQSKCAESGELKSVPTIISKDTCGER